jgi:hypothetical protein
MNDEEEKGLQQTCTRDGMVNVDNRDAMHILIENQDGRPSPFVRSFFSPSITICLSSFFVSEEKIDRL